MIVASKSVTALPSTSQTSSMICLGDIAGQSVLFTWLNCKKSLRIRPQWERALPTWKTGLCQWFPQSWNATLGITVASTCCPPRRCQTLYDGDNRRTWPFAIVDFILHRHGWKPDEHRCVADSVLAFCRNPGLDLTSTHAITNRLSWHGACPLTTSSIKTPT